MASVQLEDCSPASCCFAVLVAPLEESPCRNFLSVTLQALAAWWPSLAELSDQSSFSRVLRDCFAFTCAGFLAAALFLPSSSSVSGARKSSKSPSTDDSEVKA